LGRAGEKRIGGKGKIVKKRGIKDREGKWENRRGEVGRGGRLEPDFNSRCGEWKPLLMVMVPDPAT